MNHLVELFYPETVVWRLQQEVARRLQITTWSVWASDESRALFNRLRRQSLFIELSDGARIDVFRRTNAGLISNEQTVTAPRLNDEKLVYFGADDLCDASSENAELFLQLSAILVDTIATQVIRSKPPVLDADSQHRLLRERARRIIEAWNFPYAEKVRKLVASIARKCVETTLQPNGWLTPNGYGVLQSDFECLVDWRGVSDHQALHRRSCGESGVNGEPSRHRLPQSANRRYCFIESG